MVATAEATVLESVVATALSVGASSLEEQVSVTELELLVAATVLESVADTALESGAATAEGTALKSAVAAATVGCGGKPAAESVAATELKSVAVTALESVVAASLEPGDATVGCGGSPAEARTRSCMALGDTTRITCTTPHVYL